ncbi:DNA polymerase III subunit gamma and tau [Arenivirga flava]|uniref:DNA-directed DNA polymerase n=1 Tax=Arenivirga flava TaxID=1930060 RepID=A0AA37XBA9_9MICO|nr:DNA polymerase III subunit gamma and tau [Arenivirga flava]
MTDPLGTALRTDRVNHAYLFSGPRGCGKTTSARILARCLNCAEGPTDTPCGVCPSCVELGRDGGGSLDVVEIDAASHGGVDDARDLRERAIFAPARDRFKIFILDEAHMVTASGFNALLKIVEEPPEHVKFIFATTEPEKVIGTIRSRTHHYPFRLVPPAGMLAYLEELCASEGVSVAPGVLPLVVRAGGGSVRDTLSLLDQLIAGSEGDAVGYERAVALLGYTHGALLDEVVDAIGSSDAAGVFAAVDRVVQTGQDPRRFVEDLLERLRDLIIVGASGGNAAAVLRGATPEELETMGHQASLLGAAELSRAADVVNAALTEMTGATSPRLHLELMMARVLVPAIGSDGALARVERLERRVGVEGDLAPASEAPRTPAPQGAEPAVRAASAAPASGAPTSAAPASAQTPAQPEPAAPAPEQAPRRQPAPGWGGSAAKQPAAKPAAPGWGGSAARAASPQPPEESAPVASAPPAEQPTAPPAAERPAGDTAEPPADVQSASEHAAVEADAVAEATPSADPSSDHETSPTAAGSEPAAMTAPPAGGSERADENATPEAAEPRPVSTQQLRDAWLEVLERVGARDRNAWTVVETAVVRELRPDGVLVLAFPSQHDIERFKQSAGQADGVSEILRAAIIELFGVTVRYLPRHEPPADAPDGDTASGPGDVASGWSKPRRPATAPQPRSSSAEPDGAPAVAPPSTARAADDVPPPSDDDDPGPDEPEPAPSDDEAPRAASGWGRPARIAEPAPSAPEPVDAPSTRTSSLGERQRYGESVVRELLGATFVEEQPLVARAPVMTYDSEE